MINAEKLRALLADRIEDHRREIADFAARLVAAPYRALSGGDEVIRTAGELAVALESLSALDHGATPESLHKHALRQALAVARDPPSSTSGISNLTEQAIGRAWARMIETLESP